MPIDRSEYEKGRIDLALYVAALFRDYQDTAFTSEEILSVLEVQERRSTLEEVRQVLTDLSDRGHIESKKLEGVIYYTRVWGLWVLERGKAMPISRRQFDLGINNELKDRMEKLYSLLQQNKETAYTREELEELLEFNAVPIGLESDTQTPFDRALERLIRMGCAEAREINGTLYFAVGQRELETVLF